MSMLSVGFSSPTFEFWSLSATRLSGVVIAVWSLSVVMKIFVTQPKDRVERVVPRPVLLFTMFWLSTLMGINSYNVMSGNAPVATGWLRALLGMSFVWSIAGLAWIVQCGRRAANLELAQREVERLAATVKVPPCPEDEEYPEQ